MRARKRVAAAAAFLRVSGDRVSFGLSDLVCGRFQSGSILDNIALCAPPPPPPLRGAFAVLVCLLIVHQVTSETVCHGSQGSGL